jgi:hypothetical protein
MCIVPEPTLTFAGLFAQIALAPSRRYQSASFRADPANSSDQLSW